MRAESDLLAHLQAVTGLEPAVLRKILGEMIDWFDEDLSTWIHRRHQELRRQGLSNREIYPLLLEEARRMLVRPNSLSERQIRRLIYG